MDNIKENWNKIKTIIRKEYDLSNISYNTWIEPLKLHEVKNDVVTIIIPSDQSHALNYISNKYKNYFQVTITEMLEHTYSVDFVLEKNIENNSDTNSSYKIGRASCRERV